jgi:RND family efflux transporter MFP subunit
MFLSTALLCGAVAGCSHKSAADDAQGGTAESAAKAEVTLTKVVRADISQMLTLTGTAAAPLNQDVRVSALVSGRITELKVAEGDRVRAGQLLARIDDRNYANQLKQAEAAGQQATATLENAKLSMSRNEDLFKRGIVARKDVEDSQTQEHIAEAALHQAEATLEIARLQVTRAQILSPLNGIVVKRFVSVGEQVDGSAAQPVVEVANLAELEFLGNVPAVYLAKLHPGESVEIISEAVPDKKFAGRVVAISPAVDSATGVGMVRVRVPNSSGLLRLGLFLTAEIPIDKRAHALCVPPAAIYRDESGDTRVFVVNQDSATAVPVKLGIQNKDLVELQLGDQAGVKEGDTVILTGGYGLGDKAKIQTSSSKSEPEK